MTVVIFNSNAGGKVRGPGTGTGTTEDQLREVLSRHGIEAEIVPTDSEESAKKAVADAIERGADTILAAGGDGTVGLVASQLLGNTNVALGILPMGSVMNVARMLGISRDMDEAAASIAAGKTRLIDVGEANGVTFYETASVGLNAAMFATAQHFEDGDYGSPLKVLWTAFRYRPARMTVTLDDDEINTRALMVTISNGQYTGVAMTVAPDARLDDGRFDIQVFRHFSKFELLRHLAGIAFGRRKYSPHVSTYRSEKVTVTSRHPLPARADSHDLGTTPLECTSRRAALCVIVGPDYSAGSAAVT